MTASSLKKPRRDWVSFFEMVARLKVKLFEMTNGGN